ncbi:MAG: SRPBCC family protein [Candidatus Levyibacteriota bacterium]
MLLQSGFILALGYFGTWVWAQASDRDIAVHVERDGNAFAVAAELTVAATADEVRAVPTDCDHMAQILANVDASRITSRDGNTFEVTQRSHATAGVLRFSQDSVRQVELSRKREIRSHLLKGDLKASDFTTRIAEESGGVRITVRGKFVAGGLVASAITTDAVETQTRRQYQELRDEILRRKAGPPPRLIARNCNPAPG